MTPRISHHQSDSYPAYARSERIADGTVHALGVIFAMIGAVLLVVLTAQRTGAEADGRLMLAVMVYAVTLVATFAASACYHMAPFPEQRPFLRRLDHAAIYLKIAGTYTPLVVVIGSTLAYAVLALVWGLALFGLTRKLFFWQVPGRMGSALYLAMGWLSLLLIWPMVQNLPLAASILIATGGLLYTGGVAFFLWESLKFSNAIWHGFVLVASACFFAAIVLSVLP